MNMGRLLLTLSMIYLTACEQVILLGPVGDATVTVTELRTGNLANSGVTGDLDVAISIVESKGVVWEDIKDVGKLQKLGKIIFDDPKAFEDNTWYVITATGGFDYDPNGDKIIDGGTQVNGSLHAIVMGARLNEGQVAITPLTESAYQFVVDHVALMTDEEIQQALDQVAVQLLDEDVDDSGAIDYLDVITMNTLYHDSAKLAEAKADGLFALARSVAHGSSNTFLRDQSRSLFSTNAPEGIPEAVYQVAISPIIEAKACGPGCHIHPGTATQGPFESDNVILPADDPNHVDFNTDNFRQIVQDKGIEHILTKVSGGDGHVGGVRLPLGSSEYNTFEEWLKLL